MRRADIHQHLWPDELLSSLARRTVHPRLRHDRLELAGEPPQPFDQRDHDPATRTGFDRVLIAPSSPLGIEWLPEAECGGWAPTRFSMAASCADTRSLMPRNCGR